MRHLTLAAVRGTLVGTALAVAAHFALILATPNVHTVIPGRVLRAAQPNAATLAHLARKHGVRTVLNLRGCCPSLTWYNDESRHTADLDLDQEDLVFSASRLPAPSSIRQLIEALDRARYPVVLHCQQGVDRTGLAAACVLLLQTDAPLDQARRQMSLETGHVPLGRTRFIGRFFDLYRGWLDGLDLAHSPTLFRLWAMKYYCPAEGRTEWTLVGPGTDLPSHSANVLHLRATNRSVATWHFRPGRTVGVHGYWYLDNATGLRVASGAMGQQEADVPPGEGIDLRASLPGLPPGKYSILIELLDEKPASFTQLGDEPLTLDLLVS